MEMLLYEGVVVAEGKVVAVAEGVAVCATRRGIAAPFVALAN